MALATVPGAEFDPRQRAFDMEELRPQPIIRLGRPEIRYVYIKHRAGKAALLASWRKMTQPGEFLL